MNSVVYEMRKQRRFMAVWTTIGFAFISVFGAFTVFGLSSGIQLNPLHPLAVFALMFSISWSFVGMYYLSRSASKKCFDC